MIVPGPLVTDAEARPCTISLPTVLLDGTDRDRCPYVGDQAVTGRTLLIATKAAKPTLRNMLVWYAKHQFADGAIPASPYNNGELVLFDYNAFWVQDLLDYVAYTGDLSLARRVWPSLIKLMNVWYPSQQKANGLLVNHLGDYDYAYIPRRGTTVAYYNAGYILALKQAAQLSVWVGDDPQSRRWLQRIPRLITEFNKVFWDWKAQAYRDTTSAPIVHPEDGNTFAILAGAATRMRARVALDYLSWHDAEPYGATIADNDTWDGAPWGFQAAQRVYPFMSYYEVLARYAVGLDASGLDLIRREWGDMLDHGPGTMWETIGAGGATPSPGESSLNHGWSSGAAPILTTEVLGITPASPGFATYRFAPHLSGLSWAKGIVPTPRGTIVLGWTRNPDSITMTVTSSMSGAIIVPVAGSVSVDMRQAHNEPAGATINVGAGRHIVAIDLFQSLMRGRDD